MSREYCQDCGGHMNRGVCQGACDPRVDDYPPFCGECGEVKEIATQCINCGCAVYVECTDHEDKC